MTALPVIVVGAGLGGLLLAQGLLQSGVPFEVYERDTSLHARSQGYRMRIRDQACEALKKLTSPETWARIEETAARNFPPGDLRSAETGEAMIGIFAAAAAKESQKAVANAAPTNMLIDRTILRTLLAVGLESHIHFSKAAKSFESSKDGVTLTFSDGTQAAGSIVIGAEGRGSAIMSQLRKGATADVDGGLRIYWGKTPMTESAKRDIGKDYLGGFQITHQGWGEDKGPTITSEPAFFTHSGDPHMDDYLYFALQAYDDEVGSAPINSGAAAKDFLLSISKGYHPSVRAIFEHCDPAQLTGVRFTTADPRGISAWTTDARATALGDAVHCMPPTGAFGGTATLVDSVELCELIKAAWGDKGDSTWGPSHEQIAEYEEKLRDRGLNALKTAYTRGELFRVRPIA